MKIFIRKALMLFCCIFFTGHVFSQDIIFLKTGDEIKSKVLEITSDQIKYKKWDNPDGPTYSTPKSDVFMIKYKNGSKDVFETTNNNSPQINNSNSNTICNQKETYIGKWRNIKHGGIMTIEDNGSNLYIKDDNGQKFTAEIKNDCSLQTGIMMTISYVKGTGHLVWINGEYEKSVTTINAVVPKMKQIPTGYTGDSKDGNRTGKGIQVYDNGFIYDGEWKDDKRSGKGLITYTNGAKYDGEWKDDKKDGKGLETFKDGHKFEGEFKDNTRISGTGYQWYSNGNTYEGDMKDGLLEGNGTMLYAKAEDVDIVKYSGEWKKGFPEGNGELVYVTKKNEMLSIFKGTFKRGDPYTGTFTIEYKDGSKSEREANEGNYGKWKKYKSQ